MSSKHLSFIVATSTFLFTTIISSLIPATAHSLDVCIDIQQEIAAEVSLGASKRQLREKFPQEFSEYEQSCDHELEEAGLISIKQIKGSKEIANLILKGQNTLIDLDPVKKQQDETQAREQEAAAVQTRQQICAQVEPDEAFACNPGSVNEYP